MVQLSNHAHNVMTAEQMVVMNVETKALSAWSAKIGTMRSQSSCSSEILAAQRQCCPWCTLELSAPEFGGLAVPGRESR